MVLNRNPDNFFAETEQVAFCVAHVVPGIDFSNDPLLAGRIHSYVDTQISRLGGPNFHEIPINAPIAQVHNNQRDGMHRQAIHRGRVSYQPNSLGGGCPFQAGSAGFVSFPEPREERDHKVRGKAERFADHYTQATLFWNSQTNVEKQHIINAFRFELSRVQTPAIRERMVSGLMNVATELAESVAAGLGIREMPAPMPKVLTRDVTPEVSVSPALSLFARPGDGSIRTRRVAILVADGCEGEALAALADRLTTEGAVPRFVATTLGVVQPTRASPLRWTSAWRRRRQSCTTPWSCQTVPRPSRRCERTGAPSSSSRTSTGTARRSWRWAPAINCSGPAESIRRYPTGQPDSGVISTSDASTAGDAFVAAVAKHRHFARETDPPRV